LAARQKTVHVTEVTSAVARGRLRPDLAAVSRIQHFCLYCIVIPGRACGFGFRLSGPGVSTGPHPVQPVPALFFRHCVSSARHCDRSCFQVSGPWAWRTQRIPISEIASIRNMAPASISPMLELRLRGRSLSFSVSSESARCLTGCDRRRIPAGQQALDSRRVGCRSAPRPGRPSARLGASELVEWARSGPTG